MGLFGKKKKTEEAAGSASASDATAQGTAAVTEKGNDGFQSDPRKAKSWLQRGKTVAQTSNFDYAIECYIAGLKFDPESVQYHEELHDVAKRRKVGGGKPAGLTERMKWSGGKTPVEKALNAEFLWAKDPISKDLAKNTMEAAVKAGLPELSYWIGGITLDLVKATKPNKNDYLKICELFEQIGAWDKAAEAIRFACSMAPGDMVLLKRLKDIEAELTMMKANYDGEGGGGGFRGSVRDIHKQKALEQENAMSRTDAQLAEFTTRLRSEYEANPDDLDKLGKLIQLLQEKEDEEADAEAIKLLHEAFERTSQYRFKMKAGDVKIKGYTRRLRNLRQQMMGATDEAQKKALQEIIAKNAQDQVRFELEDFTDRAKNYPTDMGIRYQLGRRQFALGDVDGAIASFQEAQADPKHRAIALRFLGEAFHRKEWIDEAIDTYHRGIEVHPYTDDRLALELRYELCRALEAKARRDQDLSAAQEAQKVASQIAQADINYKDIRTRMDELRALINELRKGGSGSGPAL